MNEERLDGLAMAKINKSEKITEEEVLQKRFFFKISSTYIIIRLVKIKLNLNLILKK